MNTVLKYVIGLDLLNCHAKFRGDTIARIASGVNACYFRHVPYDVINKH